ncbi:hypothetical protein O6H91_15G077300 [Diphasiastrum complanatum]|uniref:Uncharacterized protein n=1 Tax=Diphasiastrum complanatum TaxID=34168 RepID=A0ACC2BJY5_DIPCM|nr:hypothetical protein O6H91_15G077300 [Diphasiastrum complanatum]
MGNGGSQAAHTVIGKTDPVVLITGCSEGGIGEALALAFAKRGCQVAASARSLASMQSLSDHPRIFCLPLDVTVESSIAEAVETLLEKFRRIDIVVNNAGVPCFGPIAELPLSVLEKGFKTNVFGAVSLTQAVVPHMVAQGKGMVVNVGSISTYAPGPWTGGYIASKCALNALTDALRLELKPFNVNVVLLEPGAISTRLANTATDVIENSLNLKLYRPFKESICKRAVLTKGPRSTSPEEFAFMTVQALLKQNPPRRFVYGHMSGTARMLSYLPLWLRDYMFGKFFDIDSVVVKNPNLFIRH